MPGTGNLEREPELAQVLPARDGAHADTRVLGYPQRHLRPAPKAAVGRIALQLQEELSSLRLREERFPAAASPAAMPQAVRSLLVVATHDPADGIGRAVHDDGNLGCRKGPAGTAHVTQNLPVFPFDNA